MGFPHCGTSILRCVMGRCDNVKEKFAEEYDPINNNDITDKEFYLMKIPFCKEEYFTEDYDHIIKVFIIRNPAFVISSINKRFKNSVIAQNHTIDDYISTLEMFVKANEFPKRNLYTIRYEDMFENDFANLKNLFKKLGFKHSDSIFSQKPETTWGWPSSAIPTSRPKNTDHDRYRVWQNCQAFVCNNELSKIDLTNKQKKKILGNETISRIYPDIKDIIRT